MSDSTATVARSPRSMAWARRRLALAEFSREFSHNRAGMVGLIFLVVVIVLALLAPVLAPSWMLDVTKLLDQPRFAPPSLAPIPVLTRREKLAENARWTREFLVPWVHRRITGRSSGDTVSPKHPTLSRVSDSSSHGVR